MRENICPNAALRELAATPPPMPVHAWRVLRHLELWIAVRAGERAGLIDAGTLVRVEEEILLASYDREIRLPLAVIVACIGSEPAAGDRLARACMCAGDWAIGQGALQVMLAFQTAAACVTGSPSYRLVAELAAVRVTLEDLQAGDSSGVALLLRRRVLEAAIAGDASSASPAGQTLRFPRERTEVDRVTGGGTVGDNKPGDLASGKAGLPRTADRTGPCGRGPRDPRCRPARSRAPEQHVSPCV